MEIWDLYDQDRNLTGETMERGEPIKEGCYHLVVHVCIFNSLNQMLIQQRQPFKRGWSNLWDLSVGGSAVANDTSKQAAHRETLEELGLDINFDGIRPMLTINSEHGFDDIYLIEGDFDINQLKLQEEEVKAAQWVDQEKIKEMIDDKLFVPYHKSLIELLFAMRKERGSHHRV